jgi:hypothetical protein
MVVNVGQWRPAERWNTLIFDFLNHRTGRLLAPSMPVSHSTFAGLPPQPSWRMRLMMSRIGMSRGGMVAAI